MVDRTGSLMAAILREWGLAVSKVGSRITNTVCQPDSDFDYLVFGQPEQVQKLDRYLDANEWMNESQFKSNYDTTSNEFTSYRKGRVNLIVTENRDFYDKFLLATRIATKLNLPKKEDRIALFQAILYDNA